MPFSTVERRTDAVVLGLALLSIGSSFLLPLPPGFQELNRSYWPRLAQILITCLLFILLFVVRSHHKSPRWRLMAVAAVVGGLVSLFSFLYFSAAFTCQYYNQSKIIGSTLTPMGSDYPLRAGDALHIASALSLKRSVGRAIVVVAADNALLEASEKSGLDVLNPEAQGALEKLRAWRK